MDSRQASCALGQTSDIGMLYVVATPLGNLGDISHRALEVLRSVDLVLAEDTRSFGILAKRLDISANVQSFFEHNEQKKIARLLELLQSGTVVALCSDAGTPTINDPGFRLVSACRAAEISVLPIPGPCAAIAALSVSGIESHRFTFEGFLPVKSGKRKRVYEEALARDGASIFYESPHRILKSLKQLCGLAPDRKVFLAREMTKLHEEYLSGTCTKVFETLNERDSVKGEIVLILQGKTRKDAPARPPEQPA